MFNEQLQALRAAGLTFADCVAAFASVDPVDVAASKHATTAFGTEDVEFDDDVVVSKAERGRWVLSWHWVPDDELPRSVIQPGISVSVSDGAPRSIVGEVIAVTEDPDPDLREFTVRLDDGSEVTVHDCVVTPREAASQAASALAPTETGSPAHWYVSGRIPSEDEATGMVVSDVASRDEAVDAFVQAQYDVFTRAETLGPIAAAKAHIAERYGDSIYIDAVLRSEAPIVAVE